MRPQKNIEITHKIPDDKNQNIKPDKRKSDDRDQIRTINLKKMKMKKL